MQILRWLCGLIALFILAMATCSKANAGTIVGNIQTATGGAVTNGTLGFTLSQSSVLSGTATLVTQTSNCYTSANGAIVGLPDPLVLPSTSTNTASGTLPSGTYYVQLWYVNGSSHSLAGPEQVVVLGALGTVNVNAPILQPASASGYAVAIGSTSGSETLQGTVTGWAQYQQSAALVTGAAVPTSNNSICSLAFSDTLVPTGTFYTVSLMNQNGSPVAGFPQTWCTYGGLNGTINVSNGAPNGNCSTAGVFYPTPLFSTSPTGAGTQSVTGNFNVGGNLAVGGNETVTGNLTANGTLNIAGFTTVGGLQAKVSGTACGQTLDLFNIDAAPTNPHKYFRVNKTTGALELVNSVCNAVIVSTDDTGNVTATNFIATNSTGLIGNALTFHNESIGGPAGSMTFLIDAGSGTGGSFNFTSGPGAGASQHSGSFNFNVGSVSGGAFPGFLSTNTTFNKYANVTTVGNGIPAEYAQVDLIGQSAAVPSTTFYAGTATGQCRLSWYAKVTTVAGTSSTLGPLTVVYNDASDGVAQTITAPATIAAGTIATSSTGNTTTTVLIGIPLPVNCTVGSNLTYTFGYASNAAATMQYELHMRLETL